MNFKPQSSQLISAVNIISGSSGVVIYPKAFDKRQEEVKDRRRKSTPMIGRYLFVGARRVNRRQSDPQARYYVDRPCKELILQGVLIILLGALDAILTFFVLKAGGIEVNPLVRFWLGQGWGYCLSYKLLFMSTGIFILLLHQNFSRVKYLVSMVCILYALLISYQAFLLYIV